MKILVAAAIAVIAIVGLGTAGFLSSVESAKIYIALPAWRLDSWSEVHGAPSGGQFQTQRQQITLTETSTGTATGTVLSGAGRYATGYVVLNHYCILPGMTCPAPTPAMVGYLVCQAPNPGLLNICFFLQAPATCYCGESVPIRAVSPGSGSNLPANRVTRTAWTEPYGTAVTVNNPAPISGGTDGNPFPAVTQSDIDAAAASARAQLSSDLQNALQVKAGLTMEVIADRAPKIGVTSNVSAGARTKTFQVTATGTLGFTEFRDSDAQSAIATGIDRLVPEGYRLNGAPVVTNFQIQSSDEHGEVTVAGKATDYLIPSFSLDALRSQLRGVSVDAARAMIETAAPESEIDIRLTPAVAPMLPLDKARISISLSVRAAPALWKLWA